VKLHARLRLAVQGGSTACVTGDVLGGVSETPSETRVRRERGPCGWRPTSNSRRITTNHPPLGSDSNMEAEGLTPLVLPIERNGVKPPYNLSMRVTVANA
jgi:hypothetical protein